MRSPKPTLRAQLAATIRMLRQPYPEGNPCPAPMRLSPTLPMSVAAPRLPASAVSAHLPAQLSVPLQLRPILTLAFNTDLPTVHRPQPAACRRLRPCLTPTTHPPKPAHRPAPARRKLAAPLVQAR